MKVPLSRWETGKGEGLAAQTLSPTLPQWGEGETEKETTGTKKILCNQ